MNENSNAAGNKRNIWMRALLMLLMALAFHVCVTVLCIVVVIQFVMLLNGTPNMRLVSFGRSMGNYLRQIVDFVSFATEEIPFPFNDWPAGG